MPVVAAAVAATFAYIGSAIAATGTAIAGATLAAGAAIGVDTAGLAFAIQGAGFALGGVSGVAAGFSAWTSALAIGGLAASLLLGAPKPASAGVQIETQLSPQEPVPIIYGRTGVGGYMVYKTTSGDNNRYWNQICVLSAGGPIQEIESLRLNNFTCNLNGDPTSAGIKTVTSLTPAPAGGDSSKLFVNKSQVAWKLGNLPESSFSTQTGLDLPNLDATSGMSGLASVLLRYDYDTNAFPGLQPQSQFTVSGVKCYDPRLDSTYPGGSGPHRSDDATTWTFSENPFICALDFLRGRRENGVFVYGCKVPLSFIDLPAFIDGANHADELNWKCGGQVVSTDDRFAVVTAILKAGSGQLVEQGALLSCIFDSPKVSIDTITSEDVLSYSITSTLGIRDRKNTVVPLYRDEGNFWNMIDGQAITSQTYIDEDSGEQKPVELQYTMVQNAVQAAQIAGYDLANLREGMNVSLKCRPRLLNRHVGEVVTINLPELPTANTIIDCMIIGREFDPASFTVNLTLRSYTAGRDAFALGQTVIAPTPATFSLSDTNYNVISANNVVIESGVSVNDTLVDQQTQLNTANAIIAAQAANILDLQDQLANTLRVA